MLEVRFYDNVEDHLIEFAVIVARSNGKWVVCKHRERETYEVPGGHLELGETAMETARRELYEETGATQYRIEPICVYSVIGRDNELNNIKETFGMLYSADISEFVKLPDYEMDEVAFLDELPTNWTYPLIQPRLIEKVLQHLSLEVDANVKS